MENNELNKLVYKIKGFSTGFASAVLFVSSVVFAWNAVWHGTDWIQTGQPITSRETAENFEYL